MKILKLSYIGLFLLLLTQACQKEQLSPNYEELQVGSSADFNRLYFSHPDTAYLTEGKLFVPGGQLWQSTDGGETWESIIETNYGTSFVTQSERFTYVFCYGNSVFFGPGQNGWGFRILPGWGNWHAADYGSPEQGMVVGGRNFNDGVLHYLNDSVGVVRTDSFPHELRDVVFTSPGTVHVAGYGLIMRSEDGGQNWQPADVGGDFFWRLAFPSAEVGYVIGQGGSIHKTTDGGQTWKRLRAGGGALNSGKTLNDLYFVNEEQGYIVGREGLIWETRDGGESWRSFNLPFENDWNGVFVQNQQLFVAGEAGKLLRIDIPD